MKKQSQPKQFKVVPLPEITPTIPFIKVECTCGNELVMPSNDNWDIRLVGVLQFKCKKCKAIHATPGLFNEIEKG